MRIITRLRTRAGLVTHLHHTRPAGRQAKRGTDRQRSVSSETAAEEEMICRRFEGQREGKGEIEGAEGRGDTRGLAS
jgi:hypothetical protein